MNGMNHPVPRAVGGLGGLLDWFAGSGSYMRLADCMGGDTAWIALTVVLDLAVAAGYIVIAAHWGRNERTLQESPAKSALRNMKVIFIFCGLCGYLFIPIKMLWPAWRLYDAFLVVLVFFTWRYAFKAQELRVVYQQLDRTEQLRLELESAREEARRRAHFLAAISHDLRTPLNGMSLHAELAAMSLDSDDPSALRESLAEIHTCVRSAAELLGEFLEVGRIEWTGDPLWVETVELDALVARAVDGASPKAEARGLSIDSGTGGGTTIQSDRRMLDRILGNLLDNAVKFTREGGVRVEIVEASSSIEVRVIDTGIGIAPEYHERVFQDFFQVDNPERDRRKGVGLGLPVAARIARQLGGEIRLESDPGRGSRLTLRLPSVAPGGIAPARGPGSGPGAGRPPAPRGEAIAPG